MKGKSFADSIIPAIAVIFCLALTSNAQLTHQQKLSDFRSLVGLYNKQYAPYEWKVQAFDFDLLQLQPWLEQVNASHDDLEFYDVCVRYVASLQDSHDEFILPSGYEVYLPITADIYDGRVLVDFIDRTALDPQTYPFQIGDELLSVDGKSVGDWIVDLRPYAGNAHGNSVSEDRIAVATILDRYQGYYPYAGKVHAGDEATIVVRSQNGTTAAYKMTWHAVGPYLPLDQQGPVPNPGGNPFNKKTAFALSPVKRPMRQLGQAESNSWGIWTGESSTGEETAVAKSFEKLQRLQEFSAWEPDHVVAGALFPFSSHFPSFAPPPGFKLRLGAKSTDEFVSGTFPVGNSLVGFIRIPSFSPLSQSNALKQFQAETSFFQANTSGLVIDLMSNGGGNICYANTLIGYLYPQPYQVLPIKLRATKLWLLRLESLLDFEQSSGRPQSDIDLVKGMLDEVQRAFGENRGLTEPLPVYAPVGSCNSGNGLLYQPAKDAQGHNIAFTKPLLLLTDNFTISAAEMFAATLQDLNRVSVYGVRTDGGGGNVVEFDETLGPYAEGYARITQSIAVRNKLISTPGLPSAPYIENIGIQPDFPAQFNTRENLLTGGQPFVNGFRQVIGNLINGTP
jgi:peptidase S41-like protein/PDZ domain-containing protein